MHSYVSVIGENTRGFQQVTTFVAKHQLRIEDRIFKFVFCVFQFSSVTQSCLTLCDPMDCSMPGLPVHHNSWSLLKLMSIESVMPSNHLILCHPLLLLPSIFSSIRVFSNESAVGIRWPNIGVSAATSVLPVNTQLVLHPAQCFS